MEAVIYNLTDLRAEIIRLKAVKIIQEDAIATHFNSPSAIFHTVTAFFKGSASANKSEGILGTGGDMVSLISRFVLPFVLNKTIFRSSNFIIKTIVGLVSQKASGFINEKSVVSVWDKAKSLIPNILHKKDKKKAHLDYAIPPDSERY